MKGNHLTMQRNNKGYRDIKQSELAPILSQNSDKIVLLTFVSSWSGSSSILNEIIKHIAPEFEETVIFLKIDIDKAKRLKHKFDIENTPTSILFQNDQVIDKFEGLLSKTKIKRRIENFTLEDE